MSSSTPGVRVPQVQYRYIKHKYHGYYTPCSRRCAEAEVTVEHHYVVHPVATVNIHRVHCEVRAEA